MRRYPATASQLWYWGSAANGWSTASVELGCRVQGWLDRDRLQAAVDALVARHPSLRTRLVRHGDRVLQEIDEPRTLELADVDGSDVDAITSLVTRPFHIQGGSLVRAGVCRLTTEEHLFVLVAHHAVCDGWSWAVLYRDLVELERALAENRPPRLPELPIHMGSYAVWEQQALQRDVGPFWREWLSSGHPLLRFGRVGAVVAACGDGEWGPGDIRTLLLPELSAQTAAQLATLAKDHNTSLPRVIGAGVVAAVSTYAAEEITVAVVTANRSRPGLQEIVGNLADQLPVRIDLRGDPTFDALVERCTVAVTSAYEHAVPSEALRRTIRANPQRATGPIFDVELNWLGRPAAATESTPEGGLIAVDIDVPVDDVREWYDEWVDHVSQLTFVHMPLATGRVRGLVLANVAAVGLDEAEALGARVSSVITRVSRTPGLRLSELIDINE